MVDEHVRNALGQGVLLVYLSHLGSSRGTGISSSLDGTGR